MKKIVLDKYEKKILRDIEDGKYVQVENIKEEMDKAKMAAKETLKRLKKTENVNLRMVETDLTEIKTKAMKNGLPYQTLMATILHQYASGKIEIKL